jgi:murein DD-endopeptidase MepM/ murein hydrolase activator NlpD
MSRWLLALGLVGLLVPTTAAAHPRRGKEAPPIVDVHVVKKGETVAMLARRYGVSPKAIVAVNHLKRPDQLRVGQKLVIPGQMRPAPANSAAAARVTIERNAPVVGPPAQFVLEKPELNGAAPSFLWPVEGPVSSQFGRRRIGWHTGIDIQVEVGTPVVAAAPGTVYYSGWEKRYGLVVKIKHPGEFITIYAHNLQLFVEAGDEVYQGQVIGTVGKTGRASAYHVHFEIRNNGKVYNPLHLLPPRESTESTISTQPDDEEEDGE